jgi:hypothetical protein
LWSSCLLPVISAFEKQKSAENAMENRNSGDAGITESEEWEKTAPAGLLLVPRSDSC